MTLRSIVRIYVVAAVALLAASVAAASNIKQATSAEALRSQSLRLADELRQTSDDLTRMGRIYVVTGGRRYRDYSRRSSPSMMAGHPAPSSTTASTGTW